ncbi:signal recognition particle-docking protein FtsY [Enterobacteriaceae endosymbiont of Donacia tomentosa]|uniref:signal recognition particle-docking protein FtsY n=1 Tax=Enterobacteriaceae endosymbiont of Donacia tomentosa TaxID=2675787 RepID=UPI001449106E|nr:signal recognition particle-docking protein FtsY [Enterobacteriaceae endosymbiont of Donacia tomentosa]QJC31486.1 signal recognition particle-docking protein FtsY [Enterobacteriaceae endosymbiont of Donacia tomentosa]
MINKKDSILNTKKKKTGIGFFSYFKKKLLKTSKTFSTNILNLFKKKYIINSQLFNELKEKLITSDISINTTKKIIDEAKKYAELNKLQNSSQLYEFIKQKMLNILLPIEIPLNINNGSKPFIILIIGVNGVGKTTTIGKLSNYFHNKGKSVLLASGDTFRAGAHEQLLSWSNKSKSIFMENNIKHDSSAIIYDAIYEAKKKNIDVLIADTAGRIHNNLSLMRELKKIVRVIKKTNKNNPDEIMLILDANIGQNSINQLKAFHDNIGVTGITITKLDGTARAGVIFSIAYEFNIPLRYVCIGEKIDDIHLFNAKNFIDAIFTKN